MVQIGGRLELDFNSCRRESGGEDKKGVVRPAGFLCRTQKNILDIDPLASRRGRYIWGADLALVTLKAPVGYGRAPHPRPLLERRCHLELAPNFYHRQWRIPIFRVKPPGAKGARAGASPKKEGTRGKKVTPLTGKAPSTFRKCHWRAIRAGNPGLVTSTVLQSPQ